MKYRFTCRAKKILIIAFLIALLLLGTSCQKGFEKVTGPAPEASSTSSGPNFTFVVMADSRGDDNGINSLTMIEVLKKIKGLNPQPKFAVIPGDLCGGAKNIKDVENELRYFKKVILEFYPESFYYIGLGNHEVMYNPDGEKIFSKLFSNMKVNYMEGYNNTVYYFDYGKSRFFMLNSDHPTEMSMISDKQVKWVKSNLNPNYKHSFFFMHEPSFPTGYKAGKSLDSNRYERDVLWEMIDDTPGSIVFCGHEHFYSRRHIDSKYNEVVNGREFTFSRQVYQVTVGGFGGPLQGQAIDNKEVDVNPILDYCFAVVEVYDNRIAVKAYGLDGKIIDNFEQEH